MSSSSSRLEKALELYCELRRDGGDLGELIARHPELAEELSSFLDDAGETVATAAGFPADFEPVREIGRGGVGVVFEARQRSLQRRVALKLLHDGFAGNPAALARFHREAQLLARLDHPGIVRVLAADATASPPWLAMEFVDGVSLAGRLQQLRESGHRGATVRELVAAIAQVAEALQHAHRQGIVHRDVKPSNILLRADSGDAVLTDFGLARDEGAPALTRTGVAAGTPFYMAPERILGGARDGDPRSDVFSLGLTLFECLALRRAYDGATSQEVLQKILADDAPELRRLAPGVPLELAAIVHKAIEREPSRRYEHAGAFAEDLRAFLDLRPVKARPVSRGRRLWRVVRRHPLRSAMVMVLSATLVFATVLAWRWPDLQAAARLHQQEMVEEQLAQGTMARYRATAEESYAHFRRAIELGADEQVGFPSLCFAISLFAGKQEALDALDEEIARNPERGELASWMRLRALLLRGVQRDDEARAIEQSLGPPRTWLDLWITADPLLEDQSDKEAYRRASVLLTQAILVAPRPRLWLHLHYAKVQLVIGEKESRVAAGEALLELWPDNPRAKSIAGTCMLTTDPERARQLLESAVAADANDILARLNLGIAQIMTGRAELGAATIAEGFPHVDLSQALRQRSLEILSQVNQFELEAECAQRWLELEPECTTARRFVARAATRAGDSERALSLFRQCLAEAPDDAAVQEDLAFALLRAGDAEGALEVLWSMTRASPDHPRVHLMLLDAFDDLGDEQGKLAELQRWTQVKPDDAAGWRELATARLGTGAAADIEPALAAAEQADYLGGGRDDAALQLRAVALERLGRTDEALRVRDRIAALAQHR
ncbi:MAG: protein kinase [Planctomycetes bacterium]|nr:protein kinase [Planctomycetota bacterium]